MACLQEPWLRPQTYEDTHGLDSNVTFAEGLVSFCGTWFAYYGQSHPTVAVADPARPFRVEAKGGWVSAGAPRARPL